MGQHHPEKIHGTSSESKEQKPVGGWTTGPDHPPPWYPSWAMNIEKQPFFVLRYGHASGI